jgi:inosine/xanthosine triphosphatase
MVTKVAVASKNPVKIESIRLAFLKMFPKTSFKINGFSVPSDISSQPIGEKETQSGAKNRVKNLSKIVKSDYYIGIEGGSKHVGRGMETFAWVVIKSQNKISKSRTSSFFLPKKIIELINQGKELGEADDIVFNRQNSKQSNGAVGILTNDVVTRTSYYEQAVIMALIPFKNPDLY